MSDLQYWIALNMISGIGPVYARKLLSAVGSPENIFQMPVEELKKVHGLGQSRLNKITGFRDWDRVNREIDLAEKKNVRLVTQDHPLYPEGLKRINDAPIVLYVRGELRESDKYAVAMVGSRNATEYGIQVAEKIAYKLAQSGLSVVSGMARGIDAAAHKGALRSGGRTIAVLGSGVDVPYPASNRKLMDAVEMSGAVISEFPLGTPPNRENFPRRNRIVSALSFGTVVVEAALDSGSLITVGYALEQGKEVFAVPGNVTSRQSMGTNDLIKKGARLVERAEEVIEELRPQLKGVLTEDMQLFEKDRPSLSNDEEVIYNYLNSEPKHIDAITRETDMTSSKTLSLLLNLELKGIIRQTQGKHFSLN